MLSVLLVHYELQICTATADFLPEVESPSPYSTLLWGLLASV